MNTRVPLVELDREQSTLLRGIGILAVLLGHTWYIPFAGAIGVAIFLIQSGYGLNVSCTAKGLAGYWGRRLRKVYLPYVLVGVFDVLVMKVEGSGPVLCTILGLDLDLIADRTMWYISYILAWYLLYYLAARLTLSVRQPVLRETIKLALLLSGAFALARLFDLGVWHAASAANLYGLCFPLGVLLSDLRSLKLPRRVWLGLWLGVLFLSTAYLFRIYPFEWNSPLMTGAAAAQAIALLQLCRFPPRVRALLSWFGRYSYPIYLFEGRILALRYIWFANLGEPVLIDLAFIAFSALLGAVFWSCYLKLEEALFGK